MMSIRPLRADDHDDWLSLWWDYLDFYGAELTTAQTQLTFARLIDPGFDMHGALAIDDTGRAIGLTHWLTHPATWAREPYCYLEDLFVNIGARRSGAGAALIGHVREWAASRGCAKVYWLTRHDNDTARRLYDDVARHSGFVQYEIDLGVSREDAS
jgi:GNAT superfamily N-acetyltransferase